jgi:di/tricarboxylate transporter
MSGNEAAVLVVLVGMAAALATRRVSPTFGVVGALLILFVTNIADADEAFQGLSNSAPLTVAALYVVAGGVQRTGALASAVKKTAGDRGITRVLFGSAAVSTFVANTPVVAILIDPIIRWARERGHAPSLYLIPLSYATILGGMTTVIGTSTNLVASGTLTDLGTEPLTFFEPAKFGLPVGLLGLMIVVMLGPRVLPSRGESNDGSGTADAGFLVACEVVENGTFDGRSIEDAGLRNLPGMFLVAVTHGESGEVIAPVAPAHVLRGGDLCSFAGAVDDVVELRNREGLRYAESEQLDALDDGQHAWFETVIGNGSSLIGRTMKEAEFRERYQAAVVGLHRAGRPITGKLGQERLRLGDALLLVSDLGFAQRWHRRSDFLLIRQRNEPAPSTSNKATVSMLILAVVVILTVTQVTDVLRASVIGAALTVATGIHTPRQARDAVDLNVVVLIAAALVELSARQTSRPGSLTG